VFRERLQQKLAGVVEFKPEQIEALESHYQLLLRWNRVLNLTSIDSLDDIIERHYGESLFLGKYLPDRPLRIVDIGSGAGFPGFPVAVLRPDCTVALVESHQRKAVFLREAARRLGNVQVVARRAEQIDEQFDFAISRAVSYENIAGVLHKLASAAALLTGAGDPPGALGFTWTKPVPLPWGKNRFLRIGVSRET
jgi:16S rRNA (guanine527-N7)-methyltransferase